jgi:hypothetical protein
MTYAIGPYQSNAGVLSQGQPPDSGTPLPFTATENPRLKVPSEHSFPR